MKKLITLKTLFAAKTVKHTETAEAKKTLAELAHQMACREAERIEWFCGTLADDTAMYLHDYHTQAGQAALACDNVHFL